MPSHRTSKKSRAASAEHAVGAGSVPNLQSHLALGFGPQLDKLSSAPLTPGLYLVSTPIGNLGDISLRALHTLAAADLVFCEDTRHSRKLFSAFGLGRKLETYHDFSGERDRARILDALGDGKSVALLSDAGTPLIADPGFKLVRAAIAAGFSVFPVPGPSAVLAALVASGLPSDQFFFGGFLPHKAAARRNALEALRSIPGTLIFFETASRLASTLDALSTIWPDRTVALARELTKLHEAILRGSPRLLADLVRDNPPLGELVLLIGPGEPHLATEADIEAELRLAMKTLSLKKAVEKVAKGLGAGKKVVYNLALKLRHHEA
jgi:16S rRNA (cytidine1402-2'-O)-methyltransferase